MRTAFLLSVVFLQPAVCAAGSIEQNTAFMAQAQQRWQTSAHGTWLARILPPALTPAGLPQPDSAGAALLTRYCVQCHHLPNPAMHTAGKWRKVVDRMVVRMRGKGNMGQLMSTMMGGIEAPDEEEVGALLDYLQRNSQRPIERGRYPDLASRAGRTFDLACSQCHELPDPRAHRAKEWPRIVARMERNMAWMNRVVGSKANGDEPQLRVDDILSFLQRHAPR